MYMNNILRYQFDLLMIILRGRDTLSTINQFIEKIQIKKKKKFEIFFRRKYNR